ncbi:hypothetical protein, partial [Neobacillus drentensis]|uniref:hypothetical protein n=1 Tax=Neobacillus drentensis TaxID=220684 RepID=UPI003000BB72
RTFLAEEHFPVGAEQGVCTFLCLLYKNLKNLDWFHDIIKEIKKIEKKHNFLYRFLYIMIVRWKRMVVIVK